MTRLITFGKKLTTPVDPAFANPPPDWRGADPKWIKKALRAAVAKPSGGWYVLGASSTLGTKPQKHLVGGRELVVWRGEDRALRVAPDACPHMGASLSGGRRCGNELVCPWHGLRLGDAPHGGWHAERCRDDGVLAWVRLPEKGEATNETPPKVIRPERFIDVVIVKEARCDPEDVIANRLDPWHGAHFHRHTFARLKVLSRDEESIVVRVVYRIAGRLGMEVDARFHCPGPRTIVMTIIDGDGVGSVVETHATPRRRGETAVIEATLATSERIQFRLAELVRPVVRSLMRRAADRLWKEDAAYAERRYQLRTGSRPTVHEDDTFFAEDRNEHVISVH